VRLTRRAAAGCIARGRKEHFAVSAAADAPQHKEPVACSCCSHGLHRGDGGDVEFTIIADIDERGIFVSLAGCDRWNPAAAAAAAAIIRQFRTPNRFFKSMQSSCVILNILRLRA
jgi:hypothetical protein